VELSGATISIEIDPSKKALDFEMFRVPISSRGYINDDGVNKIVFTAELPSEERYEISEIALYSAGSNPTAGSYDSKTVYAFTDSEQWQFDNANLETTTNSITVGNNITSTADALQIYSNNDAFLNDTRAQRYERCRYLSNVIMTRGSSSYISPDFTVLYNPKSLKLTPASVDFSKNSTSDLIKIAFSIVSVVGDSTLVPDTARVMVEFSNSDGSQYARFNAEALHTEYNFATNRYIVVQKRLDELSYSNTFSWSAMTVVKIYTSTMNNYTITTKAYSATPTPKVTLTTSTTHNLKTGDIVNIPTSMGSGYSGTFTVVDASGTTFTYVPTTTPGAGAGSLSIGIEAASSQYFVALDAVRLDNLGTINPLYGMTGYAIIQNTTQETIVKNTNSNNYIEFRVVVDVT